MEGFLSGLLQSLERRCTDLKARCATASSEVDLRDHAVAAYRSIEQVRREVEQLLADPSLGLPLLLPNQLQSYRRWNEGLTQVEGFLLPFLERYSETDRRLTRLCQRLALQVRWPLSPPLIGAFSSQYYWTVAPLNVIAVPAGETSTLLGLPDLCHEMGHVISEAHAPEFLTDFDRELTAYIRREQRRIDSDGRPPAYKPLYDVLLAAWVGRWKWEFLSDMIASYLIGMPFGWQHLRLCAGQSGATVYAPALDEAGTSEHPANEARMRGVRAVLELVAGADFSDQLKQMWDRYVATSGEHRPAEYDVCYPQSLIEGLARRTVDACKVLGLRAFDEIGAEELDIPTLLQQAWEEFRRDPRAYGEWERSKMERLWDELGF